MKQAISLAPQSAPAYLQFGKLRVAQKKFPEGVALLEQALQLDPNSVEALWLLASYDLYQKNPGAALNRVNAQIAKSPNNSHFYIMLAQLQVEARNLDAATDAVQKAMQVDPEHGGGSTLRTDSGSARAGRRRDQCLGTVVQVSPERCRCTGAPGHARRVPGRYPQGGDILPKGSADQTGPAPGREQSGLCDAQNHEDLNVALTLAQTARRALPNSPSTADTLAWAYYKKGAYAFARDLLEDALKTNVNDATMQYHLGMVYSKLENKNNAVLHLKKAIALAPESSSAKDAKVALEGLG